MNSDTRENIKTIVAVPATAGIVAAMFVAPVAIAAMRGGRSFPSDEVATHKAGEHAIKTLWEWVKR